MNSFHQNVAGHYAYAVLTAPALFGTPVARSDARQWPSPGSGCPMSARRAGRPGCALPDLNSPAVAQAAARAGVTKAELRQLRTAQRDGTSNTALDRLDARITAAAKRR